MDSARSWAVAAGCCWMQVFSFAILRSAGVIYVATLQTFPVTRQEASWPVTLVSICYSVGALAAAVLSRYVKIWKLTFAGSVVSGVAVSANYFASGVPFLAAFLGILHDLSVAPSTLCNTVINQHFDRYKATASGLSNAGLSIGGLLFPPLMQFLFNEYGFRGALFLTGGVLLNSAAGSLLHRIPPKGACPPPLPQESTAKAEEKREGVRNGFTAAFPENEKGEEHLPDSLTPRQIRVVSQKTSGDIKYPKFAISVVDDKVPNKAASVWCHEGKQNKAAGTWNAIRHALSFLTQPKFYIIQLTLNQTAYTMTTYVTILVDFAIDRNVSKWSAVILLTIYTASDVAARLLSGWITDKGFLSRTSMVVINLLLMATSVCLTSFSFSYYSLILFTVVSGWCYGSVMILVPVLFMDLVEPSKFSICFGVAAFVTGISELTRPTFVGYFRDMVGDYNGVFRVIAALQAFNAFVWIVFSLRKRCFTNRYDLNQKKT